MNQSCCWQDQCLFWWWYVVSRGAAIEIPSRTGYATHRDVVIIILTSSLVALDIVGYRNRVVHIIASHPIPFHARSSLPEPRNHPIIYNIYIYTHTYPQTPSSHTD